jgi:3-hydroxyisobutyrate dehydrogenase
MVRNVSRAGYELTVRDLAPERQAEVASELGASEANVPADFAGVDAVVTMLPTGADVREVLLDWGGGLAAALSPGAAVVDMSSSVPTGTRELGRALGERGIALVDAPVSGGVLRAESGELAIMVGGDDEAAIDRVQPLLASMGAPIFRTGPLGTGHAMKALNNFVGASGFVAVCEALIIGRRFGLEPAVALEVMNAGTGKNFNTENTVGPHVIGGQFAAGFALPLMTKDVAIAAGLADALGIDAPACRLMKQLWSEALADEGQVDFTAAFRHWERANASE